MTKKTAITAGAALLLVGAGAVAYINRDSAKPAENTSTATTTGKSGTATSGGLAPVDEASHTSKAKPRDVAENSELVAKYGESRTNLSKHVATNVIGLIEDGVEMGEFVTSDQNANAFGGPRGHLDRSLGGLTRKLNLTEEQQDKAAAALVGYQKREIVRAKGTIERLKKDPTALMKLMLASDSLSRGEITQDEYKQAQQASNEDLKGVMNPLDRRNLRGQPLKDEEFVKAYEAVLDPAQTETFQREVAEQESREASGDGSGIAAMPSMDLEKLDTTIAAAKQYTFGMKNMVQSMGNLQDLGQMMEQQRKAREAQQQAPESTDK